MFAGNRSVALGLGVHSLGASLTVAKRVDPLAFFGSYSFARAFPRTYGQTIDIGNTNNIRFGTILAASPEISLRAAFNLTFFDLTSAGSQRLSGTDEPAGVLEFGATVLFSGSTLRDVTVGAEVTRNSPAYQIGIAMPVRF